MSALPPNADIGTQPPDVCFVPKADMAAISLAIFVAIRPAPILVSSFAADRRSGASAMRLFQRDTRPRWRPAARHS